MACLNPSRQTAAWFYWSLQQALLHLPCSGISLWQCGGNRIDHSCCLDKKLWKRLPYYSNSDCDDQTHRWAVFLMQVKRERETNTNSKLCFSFFLEPENCKEDDMSTIYGRYIWQETFPQVLQEMICNKPITNRAYRLWWDITNFFILQMCCGTALNDKITSYSSSKHLTAGNNGDGLKLRDVHLHSCNVQKTCFCVDFSFVLIIYGRHCFHSDVSKLQEKSLSYSIQF